MQALFTAPSKGNVALAAASFSSRRDRFRLADAVDRVTATVRVQCCTIAGGDKLSAAWARLADHAIEPNVFLEPAFALPLLCSEPNGYRLLLAHDMASNRLIGLLPIRVSRLPLLGAVVGWRHELIAAGHPLLDRDHATSAWAAMLHWLARLPGRSSALVLGSVPLGGAFEELLRPVPPQRIRLFERHCRAALIGPGQGSSAVALPAPSKDQRRQRRRLGELGTLATVSSATPEAIAFATEAFLTLEHQGWKGRRTTSMLATPKRAGFLRTMTAALAIAGKCRIEALQVESRAVATGIVLRSGDRAYFWKTAFDETVARYSPGALFTADLALRQKADPSIALTDSCAMPDHPMIDRLWPDRLGVADVVIALQPQPGLFWALVIGIETGRRRCRAMLKRCRNRLRRRRTC